jgi:hypothetical protein
MGTDLIVFRRGSAAVVLTVFAARGSVVDGQAVELANRMASRPP